MKSGNNIKANRRDVKWSRKELIGRVLWGLVQPLFWLSPRTCWGWRRFLLRLFGAGIGAHANIHPSARIAIPWNLQLGEWSSIGFDALIYNLGIVRIGSRVTVSQRSHLCAGTHDFRQAQMPLIKATIEIGDDAWICADAFIGPYTKIGEGAVVGARAVVVREVMPWTVVAGNPAKTVSVRSLITEEKAAADESP